MKQHRILIGVTSLAALTLVAACGTSSPTSNTSAGSGAATPIKVGTLLSVTGPSANLGDKMRSGLSLAIDQINGSGGIAGRKIDWKFYDPAGDTAQAVSLTRKMLNEDKVDVVVGGGSASGIALAMGPLTQSAGVAFMATEGARTIVEPVDKHSLTFKATFNDTEIVQRTVQFWQSRNIKKVAFLPDTSGFGQSALAVMKSETSKAGIELLVEQFDPSATDLTPQLAKLAQQSPEAYMCWTTTPAGVVFMKNAHQLGLDKKALIQQGFGFVDARFFQQAGDAGIGVILTSPKLPVYDLLPASDPSKQTITDFVTAYKKKFNSEPNVYAGQTYDGMNLIAKAIEKAGSTEGSKVAAALETLGEFKGVTGVYNFSAQNHSGLKPEDAVMIKWDGTRFVLATN